MVQDAFFRRHLMLFMPCKNAGIATRRGKGRVERSGELPGEGQGGAASQASSFPRSASRTPDLEIWDYVIMRARSSCAEAVETVPGLGLGKERLHPHLPLAHRLLIRLGGVVAAHALEVVGV